MHSRRMPAQSVYRWMFLFAALSYFGACLSPIWADEVEYQSEGVIPSLFTKGPVPNGFCGSLVGNPCPTASGVPIQFTLRQFNPALGTLQGVSVSVSAMLEKGFAGVTVGPANCTPPHSIGNGCHNEAEVDIEAGAMGSVSTGGFTGPLSFSDAFQDGEMLTFGAAGGSNGFQFPSYSPACDYSYCVWTIAGSGPAVPLADYVGTTGVHFSIASELDFPVVFGADYNGAIYPMAFTASVTYDYTPALTPPPPSPPAVPEPSLLLAVTGIGGALVWKARRQREAEQPR